MTTPIRRPFSSVLVNGQEIVGSGGRLKLDAMAVPYGSGQVTLQLTDTLNVESRLDPRNVIRANVTTGLQGDGDFGESRFFDLTLRRRTVNHKEKTVTLDVATDEAILQAYRPLVDSAAARAFETSVRGVCNYVLRTAIPPIRQNLARNPWPIVGGSAADWGARWSWARTFDGTDAIFTCPSTQDSVGRGFDIRGNVEASSPAVVSPWDTIPVKAGVPISISVSVRSSKTLSMYLTMRLHDGAGHWIGGYGPSNIGAVGVVNSSGTRLSHTYTPSVDGFLVATVRAAGGVSLVAGDTIRGRWILIEPGATSAGTYFDGNAGGAHAWDGATGDSTSRLNAVLDTSPSIDADVSAYWEVTNEFTNPAPSGTTGYTAGTGTSAVANATFASRTSLRWTASGTTASFCNIASGFTVQPGRVYKVIGEFGSSVSRGVGFMVRWLNADGGIVKDVLTATVATSTSAWTRLAASVTAPRTAVKANVYAVSQTNTSGQFHYLSRLMWYEGVETIAYFDGGTSSPATYTYQWEDAANASPSTRIPVVDRDPDLYTWPAGTSAWDFLEPIVASANLRLFCDEQRVWRLIDPDLYAIPNVVTVTPTLATEGTDTITVEDPEVYCTGVAVVYSWTNALGIAKTRTDSAGVAGLVLRVSINRPWPGAGVAAWMLARRTGQGRQQDVTAYTDLFASPAMQVSISLPGTSDQIGALESVTWGLSDGLMELKTRALTDLIPGSIDALTGTIDELVGTIASL